MSDLLPCPFCNDAMKMDADGMFQHIEQTAKCPIAQMGFIHRDRWNTRAAQAQIDAAVKAELMNAADMLDKRHRGDLPAHIPSESGNWVRELLRKGEQP
jgi:hypothetical protein